VTEVKLEGGCSFQYFLPLPLQGTSRIVIFLYAIDLFPDPTWSSHTQYSHDSSTADW
jgi:hypothetical protein